jgi:hypothetical protein
VALRRAELEVARPVPALVPRVLAAVQQALAAGQRVLVAVLPVKVAAQVRAAVRPVRVAARERAAARPAVSGALPAPSPVRDRTNHPPRPTGRGAPRQLPMPGSKAPEAGRIPDSPRHIFTFVTSGERAP